MKLIIGIVVSVFILLISFGIIYIYSTLENIEKRYGVPRSSKSIPNSKKSGVFVAEYKITKKESINKLVKTVWLERTWVNEKNNDLSKTKKHQLVVEFINESIYYDYLTKYELRINDKPLSGFDGNAVYRIDSVKNILDEYIIEVVYLNQTRDTIVCSKKGW